MFLVLLEFKKLEFANHVSKNLLESPRSGTIEVSGPITTVLLASGNALRGLIVLLQDSGAEVKTHFQDLIPRLTKLNNQNVSPPAIETRQSTPSTARSRVPLVCLTRRISRHSLNELTLTTTPSKAPLISWRHQISFATNN